MTWIPRFQLFEIMDQGWCPRVLRDGMTDYLRFVTTAFRAFEPALPILERGLAASGGTQVLDLASGGGGAWPALAPLLRERVPELQITLSDYFPNHAAGEQLSARHPDLLRYEPDSVDARDVPARLAGLRTQFLSIHHFAPDDVVGILKNAVDANQPIAFFEAQRRDLRHLISFAFSPLGVLLMTPFNWPQRLGRLVFTYLLPLIPLATGWDGTVSILRTYTCAEWLELAAQADPDGRFTWESEELAGTYPGMVVPYLLGVPQT